MFTFLMMLALRLRVGPMFDKNEPARIVLLYKQFIQQAAFVIARRFNDRGQARPQSLFATFLGVQNRQNIKVIHCITPI